MNFHAVPRACEEVKICPENGTTSSGLHDFRFNIEKMHETVTIGWYEIHTEGKKTSRLLLVDTFFGSTLPFEMT